MSFSFGFGGDDIEDGDSTDSLADYVNECSIEDAAVLVPPKRHNLQDMLKCLPSQLSYNFLRVLPPSGVAMEAVDLRETHFPPMQPTYVARRSVFDIRAQLMAEANAEDNDNDTLLAGLERGDLSSGVYEGGFKTWECAVDLAGLLSTVSMDEGMHVIELGAGSAIPSLVLLKKALQRSPHQANRHVHFTLCDYNEDVLQLTTIPNLLLNQQTPTLQDVSDDHGQDYDLEDIDEVKSDQVMKALESSSLSFDFISGAWGDEFLRLLYCSTDPGRDQTTTLILASETIYSPASTRVFAETLLQLLRRTSTGNSKAWVAAKKLYFGVGGGVEDFQREIIARGGKVETLLDVKDSGVARVILEITI